MPGRILHLLLGRFRAPPPEAVAGGSVMTREEAVGKAEAAVAERGWLWMEPVEASLKLRAERKVWEVSTNAGGVGYNVHVLIDDETGRVLKAVENRTR